MNFGLVISYIIAGIIMLSIIKMNISVSQSATELTITQITREKTSAVTELISHDLQKMGYNRTARANPAVKVANNNKIQFYSNINNSSDNSAELITWELTNTGIPDTKNPNDFVLTRSIEDTATGSIEQTSISLGVTQFRVSYFDDYGEPLSDSLTTPVTGTPLTEIKQLYIKIGLEAAEKTYNRAGDDGRYALSVWEKRFSPPNLEPVTNN